jgi:hypothetical protein
MFSLEDETLLFLYCWTVNEMQIPAERDRSLRRIKRRTNAFARTTNPSRPANR